MSHPTDDRRLRQRFLELKEDAEREARLPDFSAMLARAKADADASPRLSVVQGRGSATHRGRRVLRVGAWATAALAAAVAGLILVDRRPGGDAEFEQLVAAYETDMWESPTDGLLDVPGIELTRSVPSIGGPAIGLDPSTRPDGSAARQRNEL